MLLRAGGRVDHFLTRILHRLGSPTPPRPALLLPARTTPLTPLPSLSPALPRPPSHYGCLTKLPAPLHIFLHRHDAKPYLGNKTRALENYTSLCPASSLQPGLDASHTQPQVMITLLTNRKLSSDGLGQHPMARQPQLLWVYIVLFSSFPLLLSVRLLVKVMIIKTVGETWMCAACNHLP